MNESLSQRCSAYVNEPICSRRRNAAIRAPADRSAGPCHKSTSSQTKRDCFRVIVLLCAAEKVVEVGTLAGYSGIWIARALPTHGKLITIEKSSVHAERWHASHFERAGLADRVTVLQGAGIQMLPKLAAAGPYDLMFIDADKANYPTYLELGRQPTCALAARWWRITPFGADRSSSRSDGGRPWNGRFQSGAGGASAVCQHHHRGWRRHRNWRETKLIAESLQSMLPISIMPSP